MILESNILCYVEKENHWELVILCPFSRVIVADTSEIKYFNFIIILYMFAIVKMKYFMSYSTFP